MSDMEAHFYFYNLKPLVLPDLAVLIDDYQRGTTHELFDSTGTESAQASTRSNEGIPNTDDRIGPTMLDPSLLRKMEQFGMR